MRNLILMAVAPFVLQLYLKLCFMTSRKSYDGIEQLRNLEASGGPFVICAWHGRLLGLPLVYGRGNAFAVISQHRDGEVIARILEYFGVRALRGSSSRGGAAVLRSMVQALRDGHDVGITPDGPRGPLHEVKKGTAAAAIMVDVPIVPLSYSATRKRFLKSWDRFLLPLPLGHFHFVIGNPILPRKRSEAEVSAEIERCLRRLTDEADRALSGGSV